jgi:hypothetical protein
MSYAYRGWRLYSWTVALNPRLEKTVYFFSKEVPEKGKRADLPAGYEVAMGPKTGVPFLARVDENRTAAVDRNSRT